MLFVPGKLLKAMWDEEGKAFLKFINAKEGRFNGFEFVNLFHHYFDKYEADFHSVSDDSADCEGVHIGSDDVDVYFFCQPSETKKVVLFNRSAYCFGSNCFSSDPDKKLVIAPGHLEAMIGWDDVPNMEEFVYFEVYEESCGMRRWDFCMKVNNEYAILHRDGGTYLVAKKYKNTLSIGSRTIEYNSFDNAVDCIINDKYDTLSIHFANC